MEKFLFLLIILIGLSLLPLRHGHADPLDVEDLIKQSKEKSLCGEYHNKKSTHESFIFGDGNLVTVVATGMKFIHTYFVYDNKVYVKYENGYYIFQREGVKTLRGIDWYLRGKKYTLKRKPQKACKSFAFAKGGEKSLVEDLCVALAAEAQYAAANPQFTEHQQRQKLEEAERYHLRCCEKEVALSCNAYGMRLYFAHQNKAEAKKYFQRACQLGSESGCKNWSDLDQTRH